MSELSALRNLGKKMEDRLKSVGISTAEELKSVGSKEAFIRLKTLDPKVCTVHLYSIEGAICDIDYNQLPEDVKKDLKEFSASFKS